MGSLAQRTIAYKNEATSDGSHLKMCNVLLAIHKYVCHMWWRDLPEETESRRGSGLRLEGDLEETGVNLRGYDPEVSNGAWREKCALY